jgi:SAM-dependent methyltransferase
LQLASATELPDEWRDRFDMVLSFTALHWVRDHAAVLRQAHKVLKPGGLLAFTMVLAGPREFTPVLDIVAALAPWRDHLQHYAPPTYPTNSGWTEGLALPSSPLG